MKEKVQRVRMQTENKTGWSFPRVSRNFLHRFQIKSREAIRSVIYISLLIAFAFTGMSVFASQGFESASFMAPASASLKGADGKTFQQRRAEWLNSLPAPTSSIDMDSRHEYFFGWLEKGIYNNVVSETIENFVGTNFWLYGPRAPASYAAALLLRYGENGTGLISSSDEKAIKDRYENTIETSSLFGHLNPNKEILVMVGVYLYTSYYDSSITLPIYGYPTHLNDPPQYYQSHWKRFSYNGNSYQYGGGPYNALELSRDWLMWRMDGWFARKISPYGNREFDSINYHRHFPHALMILAQFAPENSMRTRAKMAADVALLDFLMDFSANSQGGTIGRTDYKHMDRTPQFPLDAFWGISSNEDAKWDIAALYSLNFEPSDLIISLGKFEENWRFHMEYNERLNHNPGMGKWNYLTPNYNIGGSAGYPKQGWTVNIKGPGRTGFIRFFINSDSVAPDDKQEDNYHGERGLQFRNAIFANIGKTPHYWEFRNSASWDEQSTESGWEFKRLGDVYVAIRLGSRTASVEIAEKGVDYSSYVAFKTAVKQNASLSGSSYTTSTGITIDSNDTCGLNSPGDCDFPFDGLETESSHGKLIDWHNDVMTLSKDGLSCTYNFNNWSYSGNSCSNGDGGVPTPKPTPTPLPSPTPPPSTTFVDVPVDHWAYDYIEALAEQNYVSGCSSEPAMYCPDATMTRSEGAVFVLRGINGAGYTPGQPASSIFADVTTSEWYAKWTDGLWEEGYTAGCGTDPLKFCPAQEHTRAEGTVFFLRMLNGIDYVPPDPTGIFNDVPPGYWGARWIEAAYSAGIIPACDESANLFCPEEPLTRAMAAYMMIQAKGLSVP
jgi:hypothetical protein